MSFVAWGIRCEESMGRPRFITLHGLAAQQHEFEEESPNFDEI
jgi:hypothetical protein